MTRGPYYIVQSQTIEGRWVMVDGRTFPSATDAAEVALAFANAHGQTARVADDSLYPTDPRHVVATIFPGTPR